MKRIFLFLATNILVVLTLSIVLNLLGVRGYITAYGIDYYSLLIFCLVWGFGGAFISLALSKVMAKFAMGVQIVDNRDPSYAGLVLKVHELSRSAGLKKMPEVGVYPGMEVNAFATGPSKNNSLVAVSQGLLQNMDNDEVEAVLAHEVSHIANGDMVTMTLIQGVINAFVMFLARVAAFLIQNALRGDREEKGGGFSHLSYMLTTFVFEIIFSLLGSIVVAFFSRSREYRADSGAAKLVGANKMIKALERLKVNIGGLEDNSKAFNSMKISSKSGFLSLFSSHPALDDRIEALRKRTY